MIVGVTATQNGLTDMQLAVARLLLSRKKVSQLHHGDCIGGDAQLHDIMRELHDEPGWIVIHPGWDKHQQYPKRAWRGGNVEIRETKDYISRNHDIVDECDLMLAFPHNYEWYPHSGTWSTVTYCSKTGRMVIIIYPDGTMYTA